MSKQKRVILQDIADDLGVSKGLVSLALNDRYGVSESMRSKIVLRAIEMGYEIPQFNANDFKSLTIVINNIDLMREAFWSQIVKGIEMATNEHRISLNMFIWNDSVTPKQFIEHILKPKPQGIIVINEYSDKMAVVLEKLNLPVVLIDIKHPLGMDYDHIYANNYSGAFCASRYFIKKGHRHLAFVGYKDYSHSFTERYHGFIDKVKISKHKIKISEITERPDEFSIHDETPIFHEKSFIKMMEQEDYPTALLCANDPIAFKVYELLKQMDIEIGKDVSIIGFDNVEACEYVFPKLTSIHIPKEEIGKEAVEVLLTRIKKIKGPTKNIQLTTELIERESVYTRRDK